MENIACNRAASTREVPENIEIVPFRFDFNVFAGLNKKKLSSFAAIRLFSISLILFFLSSVGQALALERLNSLTTADSIVSSLEANSVGGEEVYLALGSTGAEVKSLQQRLQRLKYFTGDVNGYYGASTRDAVVRFQQKMGLTVDGIVGAQTQQVIDKTIQQLKRVKASSNTKILPLTVGSCSNGKCPNLRAGIKNRYVKYLQTRLRHWGYFKFNPNGNFDSKTVEAVKRFQKAKGLSADGVVGPQTWDKIENSKAKNTKIKKSNKCNNPVLQRGDKSECVAKLQNLLQKLGYFKGNSTAYFGGSTWEAVKQFQFNNELPPNGIVDSQTWKALEKDRNNYVVLVPVTSPYTLDEVRRFVPDAFIRNTKLGKFVQTGEFQYSQGAEQYSRYFLRDRGFNAQVVTKDKL
ncbi:MAG: peptidoglycan-binding protein [Cyanobacteria bacterium P01_C01_bin.38]